MTSLLNYCLLKCRTDLLQLYSYELPRLTHLTLILAKHTVSRNIKYTYNVESYGTAMLFIEVEFT